MSCNSCNTSPCCCQKPYQLPGPMGPQGCTGPQGNAGPQGPIGPPGSAPIAVYGQLYRATDLTMVADPPLPNPPSGSSSTVWTGIQNSANASIITGTKLRVTKPGIYQIDWNVIYLISQT